MTIKTKDLISTQVSHQLATMGQNLRTARKRRGWSVEKVRQNVRCSKGTLQDAEAGKPTVSLGVYVLLFELYGFEVDLANITHPKHDEVGLSLELQKVNRTPMAPPPINPADF